MQKHKGSNHFPDKWNIAESEGVAFDVTAQYDKLKKKALGDILIMVFGSVYYVSRKTNQAVLK